MKSLFTLILVISFMSLSAQSLQIKETIADPKQQEMKPIISANTPIPANFKTTKDPLQLYFSDSGRVVFLFLSGTFVGLTVLLIVNIIKVSK